MNLQDDHEDKIIKTLMKDLRDYLTKKIKEWVEEKKIYDTELINVALCSVSKEFYLYMIHEISKNMSREDLKELFAIAIDGIHEALHLHQNK